MSSGIERMIGLEWLERLVKYSILSAYIKDERPVNLLVIADIEEGKTALLSKFSAIESVLYLTDFTRYGLQRDYLPELRTRTKRVLMIPDFNQLIEGKSQTAADNITGFLNGVTEEGITRISTFGLSIDLDQPLKLGLIGAISKSVFDDRRRRWRQLGFVSRMLPISYSYTKETVARILEYLIKEEYGKEGETPFELPKDDFKVKLSEEFARLFVPLSTSIGKAVESHGFRLQRQLQVLCKAKALVEKRTTVTKDDVDEIFKLASWINLDFKPI